MGYLPVTAIYALKIVGTIFRGGGLGLFVSIGEKL